MYISSQLQRTAVHLYLEEYPRLFVTECNQSRVAMNSAQSGLFLAGDTMPDLIVPLTAKFLTFGANEKSVSNFQYSA